jgi:regulator of protease activity HflC (stomatin/prohibitin superfamily)
LTALSGNLDRLLHLLSNVSWVIFIAFTIIFFFWTVFKHGIKLAVIRLISYRVLLPLLITVGISLLSLALVFIEPPEVGVVVSLISPGGVRPQAFRAGLHWIIPLLEEVKIYPIYWQTYTMSGKPTEGNQIGNDSIRARTSDGQEVLLDTSVIFRLNANQVVQVHIDWQDRYAIDFVRPVVRGMVRSQVSQFTVREVNSASRKDLEIGLGRLLQDVFAEKGLTVDQFLLRDINFTEEYAHAVELKQVAFEGQEQKEYEAEQLRQLAQGKADAIEIEAQAQANALRLIADALQQHPDLVTYHYVEKLSDKIRVMLLPSNNPLILPLPSLGAAFGSDGGTPPQPTSP